MPIVHIEMFSGRTPAQKAELARVITDAIVTIAHTQPQEVIVVFQDMNRGDYAKAGVLASEAA
ncbi:MAG: tautomerase family protein [Chloroflexi bacterium]|nr:tautomerase family protein [Chloroflexota bacterium]